MRRDLGVRRDEQHKGPPPHRSVRASEGQVSQSESPRVLGTGGRAEGLLDKASYLGARSTSIPTAPPAAFLARSLVSGMKRIGSIGFACLSPSFICHPPCRLLRRRLRLLSRSLSEDLLRLLLPHYPQVRGQGRACRKYRDASCRDHRWDACTHARTAPIAVRTMRFAYNR